MPVSNSCDCPNPPGGRVVCEPNQAAVCIVKDGIARQECHNPPTTSSAAVVVNWALTKITGIHHPNNIPIELPSLQMLETGAFKRDTGETVTFALPQSVWLAIHASRNQLQNAAKAESEATAEIETRETKTYYRS